MGAGFRGWVKKVKGIRSTNWQLQNSPGDVKYSIGNTVNDIVTTACMVPGGHQTHRGVVL